MATKWYLPSTGAAPVAPANDTWDKTAGAGAARTAVRSRINSAMATVTNTKDTTTLHTSLICQYVTEPLAAQTITGNVSGQMRCIESNGLASDCVAISVRACSNNGATIRSGGLAIVSSDLYTTTSEMATSLTNRSLMNVAEATSIAFTSMTLSEGDRLVFEFGYKSSDTSASRTGGISFGDDSGTDLPVDMTTTAANSPWISFDSTIPVATDPAGAQALPEPIPRKASGECTVAANLLLTVLAVAAATAMPRAPLYTPRPVARVQIVEAGPPNLLISTLAPVAAPFRQNEWPQPRPAPCPALTDPPNLLGTTLAPSGAAPFNLDDWPTPPRQRIQQPDIVPNLAPSLPIAPPFSQDDWPIPPRSKVQQPFDPPNLSIQTPARPFSQRDWPNPTPGRVTRVEPPPNLTPSLPVAPPFKQSDWPTFRPAARIPSGDPQNLLETTLAPAVGAAPFSLDDWPIPARRVAQQPDVVPNLVASTLAQVVEPRAPAYAPRIGPIARTPEQPATNLLTSTLSVAAPPPAPFSQDDWPRPVARRIIQPDLSPNLTVRLPVAPPFTVASWPAKPVPPVRQQPTDPPNLLSSTLSFSPAWNDGFQVPVPTPRVQPDLAPNLLTTTLAGAPVPFSLDDWPRPQARQVQQTDILRNLTLSLPVAPPFRQRDWPGPAQRKSLQPELAPNLSVSTLAPAAGAAPFSLDDWPQPRPRVVQQPELPPNQLAHTIVAAPFKTPDWPTPPRATIQQPFDPPNLQGTTLTVKPPLGLYDWPVPKPRPTILTDPPNLLTGGLVVPVIPTRPKEWQNPQPNAPIRQPDQWQNTLVRGIPAAQVKPFGLSDWPQPIPRVAQQPVALPNLLPERFPTPFSQSNWPIPAPRRVTPLTDPPNLQGTTLAVKVAALTGVEGTTGVGSVLPVTSVAISGSGSTGSVGSLSHIASISISGPGLTGSVGSLSVGARQFAITGVPATSSVGTASPLSLHALSGFAATTSVGNLRPTIVVSPTGVVAVGYVGDTAPPLPLPVYVWLSESLDAMWSMQPANATFYNGNEYKTFLYSSRNATWASRSENIIFS